MTPFFVIAPFGAITNLSEMFQTGKNDFFFVIAPFGAIIITKSLGLTFMETRTHRCCFSCLTCVIAFIPRRILLLLLST